MATAGPSPYAPSAAPEVPAPPRPVGHLAVFLWAAGALSLGGANQLWLPFLRSLPVTPLLLGVAVMVPALVGLLWAYVADRWPLMGHRREGHLVLGCTITVAAWAAAPFVPAEMFPWLGIDVVLRLGGFICMAAVYGALVELARRHAAPGRIAAATVAIAHAGELVEVPLGSALTEASIQWTAGVGIAFALSIAVAAIVSADSAQPAAADQESPGAPKISFLRSGAFWGVLGFLVVARLFGEVSRGSVMLMLAGIRPPEPTWAHHVILSIAAIGLAAAYALLSRRLTTGTLLRLALLTQGLESLTWLLGADFASGSGLIVRTLADGLATLAITTLVLRAAPRGREAIGYSLLWMVPGMIGPMLTAPALLAVGSLTMGAAGMAVLAVLAALAVSLLPKVITTGRDGTRDST